ncbi:MAG: matrixin family metalloprotease [Candidatus Bathyarchaeia archaeon]
MNRKLTVAFLVVFVMLFVGCPLTSTSANKNGAGPPDLQRVVFIHYAKANAKPPAKETGYYKLLGAKWKSFPVSLEVNPSDSGLGEEFVIRAIGLAAEEWDSGAYSRSEGIDWYGVDPNLFDNKISITNKGYEDLAWTSDKLDGKNTLLFGNYSTPGVIAVTILWYDRATKTIVEFDIVFDTDYTWGNATEDSRVMGVMDLQNIATHELGHGVGLGDVYQSTAYQETMYGYSDYGETSKRDLYIGDKTGITKLYGAASA